MKVWAVLRQGVLIKLFANEDAAKEFTTSYNAIFKHAAPCVASPWAVTPHIV